MSDEYSVAYQFITSLIPQLYFLMFFPMLLVGVAVRFMRNPAK